MDKQTKEALKQMQAEMRLLQSQLADRPAEKMTEKAPAAEPVPKGKSDTLVQYNIHRLSSSGDDTAFKTGPVVVSAAQIAAATDEAAAQLGYALSSPQKVGLLRALLGHQSESASALGETAGLSTGSLYHHLRDLMHAGLLTQAGRSRYAITPQGQKVLLLLLALTVE